MTGEKNREIERHEDPFTGEPGAHPIGAGVGAAAGGVAAGMAAGVAAGPVGLVVGAVAGGVVGGMVGKGVAEAIDPTVEDAYWSLNFYHRPYYEGGRDYDYYRSAYRYGLESYARYEGEDWAAVEPQLAAGWDAARADSPLTWDQAAPAVRDAWNRLIRIQQNHRLP
jgi:hypothetical protein